MSPKNTVLNLQYNEMWNDWDGLAEDQKPMQYVHGRLVLSWKRLNVSVKRVTQNFFKPSKTSYQQILNNVSGNVQCGNLLGIMGPSGSGKTTLLATISHRTKGNFEGELLLNGQPVTEEMMIKMSGFVPQHDISFEQLTALEHLVLMANLKMDRNTTKAAVNEHVNYIVSTLGMSKLLHTRISVLSGGERKKVALAVQLLNDPPILFCDEITTGLDSYSAAHIVNTLRCVARMGKIVICTIHQPASGVFGKFDDVLLLSSGKVVYQGPVSMVHQLFHKFSYDCPNMFNEADFIISILNSENEKVKDNVNEMCKLSSSDLQTDLNYEIFNNQKKLDYLQYSQTKKPTWNTQFRLILGRSSKCFVRSYQNKLLELASTLCLSFLMSAPFGNLRFDTKAVQNWEGFWLNFVITTVFTFTYSAVTKFQERFSVVHREIHNEVYSLSVYYVSELIIAVVWIMIRLSFLLIPAFYLVGVHWSVMQFVVFFILAFAAFSYGSMVSACFSKLEIGLIFSAIYDFVALSLSGAYLSVMTLPKFLYIIRYFSLFYLGCETISTLFWSKIKFLPCTDVSNCLDSGEAVLNKYGYASDDFYLDLIILILFIVVGNVLGFFGVLNKLKEQPAY
ncbi:protein scarlet-like [Sipha flava]|uniref:Protein scarlet-like n=2 Tax=Sipha flava TaxID=143950 RepID=A0A8B8FIH2_9HEMI|nr:protein scarlet-like [Sipha flava]